MARSVRVGDYQAMQRGAVKRGPTHAAMGEMEAAGDAEKSTNGHDVNAVDPMTGQMPAAPTLNGDASQANVEGQEWPSEGDMAPSDQSRARGTAALRADDVDEPPPSMGARLRALHVGSRCTAEMSLHMITERVRDASRTLSIDYAPTESDVVREAERIWVSLDRQRSHTYSVERDGTIRDWRRPDTSPDRGDVTQVHQVGDAARFSGGGAEDAQQQSLFLVPSDADFRGKLYREAPELANLAETLIERHGFLGELANCDIRWYWKRKTGVSKGRVKIGFMKRASDLLGHFSGADFIGWLSATTARDGKFTDTQIEAAVFHQLCHVGSDEKGNWIFQPHDFEGFAAEVRHYGTWTSDLKLGGTAFVAAHQMGLFTEDEQDDDEDEDAEEGEAAEQAYFDAAGEEMERDSAADVEAFDADRPADPDGPAPDERDDPLSDVPFA